MKISEAGLDLIREHEGCALTAYDDSVGVLTIGYGHTGADVSPGKTITQDEADELLRADVAKAEACINANVHVTLTQGQFDALCSFTFNLGCAALRNSTLLRLLNAGDYDGAKEQFARWNHGGGRIIAGLTRRRMDEAEMFA